MTERIGEPWPGATYNGFSGGPALDRPHDRVPPSPPPRRRVNRGVVLGGVVAAGAAGLLFGLISAPDRRDERSAPVPAVSSPTVPVEVAQMRPAPIAPAPEKLEVLPPDMALPPPPPQVPALRAERPLEPPTRQAQVVPRAATEPPVPPRTRPAQAAVAAPGVPAAARAPEIAPPPAATRFAEAPPDPSFNCAYAGTRAERMICADRGLARLDRRLDRAFRRAVRSGVPYRELRNEQDDWLGIREAAARRSPDAVASIYLQRIDELEALAEAN